MSALKCPQCGSTDPCQWAWVQYTRINYIGVSITETSIEVETNGVVEYESVINEHLHCLCGAEVDRQGRAIVYV